MGIIDIFTPETATFIRDVGFPAFAFIIVIILVFRLMKRQDKSDNNYKDLVTQFINNMNEITEKHSTTLIGLTTGINKSTSKVDSYTREVRDYEKEVSDNRIICSRERDVALKRILDEITDVKNKVEKIEDNR